MFKLNCVCFRNEKQKDYKFLPQHFLNLRPLPQMQGSLRPIFGESLRIGVLGGQQLVSLQQASLSSIIGLVKKPFLSSIFFPIFLPKILSMNIL